MPRTSELKLSAPLRLCLHALRICAAMTFLAPDQVRAQSLPVEVQVDMAILALEESILAQEFPDVLAKIDALRLLDPSSADGELLFYEAEAALAQGDLDRSEHALVRFLSEVGSSSVNYQPALKLMLALPAKRAEAEKAARDAEAARKRAAEQERTRQAAAEAARLAAERAAAQRAEEAQRRQQEQAYIASEQSLRLSQDDIRHIRYILAQRARDYQTPPRSDKFTPTDRKRIADYYKFQRLAKPVAAMQYLDATISRELLAMKFKPEIYLRGRFGNSGTVVTNLGGDWINYRSAAGDHCYIESAATSWNTNEIFQRPVMSYSSMTTWAGDSLVLDMVTPNPFQTSSQIYAVVDGERFPLQFYENGVIKPVETGNNQVSSAVIKAIRGSKESIRIHGTGAISARPLVLEFSGWGFTAAFRKMMADCNRSGLVTWIE